MSNIADFSFQIWNFHDKWLKKGYLLADKIGNFSSISNKLSLDTTTISLVLLLSDFSLLNIDLLCLGIRPRWLRFMSTNFWKKKKLWLNFNFCVSGYFKCSMITRDSTNMLKRISSSPVFFYSPPTSFTNNVLYIDRSPYHPKTKLEFFFIESNAAGTFSRTPRNHFSIFSRFQPSKIEKKSEEWQRTQIDEPLYFVLHYYRIYSKTGGKRIRTRGAGACQRLLSTNRTTGACAAKCPLCSNDCSSLVASAPQICSF